MYRYLVIYFSLFLPIPTTAQTSVEWNRMKANPHYICGEGFGSNEEEADRIAMSDILSQISISVKSSIDIKGIRNEQNGTLISEELLSESLINTYSQGTLTNTRKITLGTSPEYHIGRYIEQSEIERIFEGRKEKIKNLCDAAMRSEQKGKIDFALKNLYWSLMLTKSLQRPNEATYTTEDEKQHILMSWIPEKINSILSDLNIVIGDKIGDDVETTITYKGIPVNSIDYTYQDGYGQSGICSAKNGNALLEMAPGYNPTYYQIEFVYQYNGQAMIDEELQSVINIMTPVKFGRSIIKIKNTATSEHTEIDKNKSFSRIPEGMFQKPNAMHNSTEYSMLTNKIIEAIRDKCYDTAYDCFTNYGLDIYKKLVKYGNAKIVGNPSFTFYESGEHIIARGLQMSFSFSRGARKSFIEDVVFTINKEQKIDNIAFGLGKTAEDDILGKSVWPENVRMAIMEFLENYQTAYALKRLDYIETIFDDNAVIITGNVVRKSGEKGDGTFQLAPEIKYEKYTKKTYIEKLKSNFAHKEYINLRFANNDVKKLGKYGEMYAIQIYQEYYSSNYGDKGYLFLMVDMNDAEHPVIKVRTWQPEPDPEFGIFGPEIFK